MKGTIPDNGSERVGFDGCVEVVLDAPRESLLVHHESYRGELGCARVGSKVTHNHKKSALRYNVTKSLAISLERTLRHLIVPEFHCKPVRLCQRAMAQVLEFVHERIYRRGNLRPEWGQPPRLWWR